MRLGRPSQQISILNVVEAVDGPLRFETTTNAKSNGTMRESAGEIRTRVRRQLDELKLPSSLHEDANITLTEVIRPEQALVGSLH